MTLSHISLHITCTFNPNIFPPLKVISYTSNSIYAPLGVISCNTTKISKVFGTRIFLSPFILWNQVTNTFCRTSIQQINYIFYCITLELFGQSLILKHPPIHFLNGSTLLEWFNFFFHTILLWCIPAVKYFSIPCSLQKFKKSFGVYFPPLLVLKTFMKYRFFFSTRALNCLNITKDS